MEAEKAIASIRDLMEVLRKGGVFMGTYPEGGQKLIEKGLFIIGESLKQQAARENMASNRPVKTLGDDLE